MNLKIYVILASTGQFRLKRIKTLPTLVFSDVCGEEDYGPWRCDALYINVSDSKRPVADIFRVEEKLVIFMMFLFHSYKCLWEYLQLIDWFLFAFHIPVIIASSIFPIFIIFFSSSSDSPSLLLPFDIS
jgi:hypothetical protein